MSAPAFLSADELSALTGYKPNQFARMRKWLRDRRWPFEDPGRGGCPRVWRGYHDQRMSGLVSVVTSPASNDCNFAGPNRARLEELQHGRKKKKA